MRRLAPMDVLLQDLRYAVRGLRKSPGFTATAVFTLALGISLTTTIYSVVDTILLQPLPFPQSDRLVRLVENVPARVAGRPPMQRGVTYQDFLEWRGRSETFIDTLAVGALGAVFAAAGIVLVKGRPRRDGRVPRTDIHDLQRSRGSVGWTEPRPRGVQAAFECIPSPVSRSEI